MTMEASAPRGSSVSDARLSKCSDVHRLSAGSPMSSTVEEDSPTVKPVPAVTPLAPLPVADPSAVLGVALAVKGRDVVSALIVGVGVALDLALARRATERRALGEAIVVFVVTSSATLVSLLSGLRV